MNVYYKIINTILIICAILAFYLAFKNAQLPFDENGQFVTEDGTIFKKFGTIKFSIYGILSIASLFVWNTLKKRNNSKK